MPEIFVTAEGLAKLEAELRFLTTTRRAEIAEEIKVARGFGDLSENAEYASAKDTQGLLETRILQLEDKLRSATVVKRASVLQQVQVGATVTVSAEDGQQRSYTIVGTGEGAPAERRISYDAPIGRALMGAQVGDTVIVHAPNGERRWRVEQLS
jgi:transcription elongation factor GreA